MSNFMSNAMEEIKNTSGGGGGNALEAYKQMIEKYQSGSAQEAGGADAAQEAGGANAAAQASSVQNVQALPQDGAQISEEAVKGVDETEGSQNTKQMLEQFKNYSSGSEESNSAVGAGGAEQASQLNSTQQVDGATSAQGSQEASKIGAGSQDVSQVQGNPDLKQTEQVGGAGNLQEIMKNAAQANFQA